MTHYESPEQAAFFLRFARWTEAAINAECDADYPIVRAFAASQAPDEWASKFLRALEAAGRDARSYWQGWRLVSLRAWGMAPGFEDVSDDAIRRHQALEGLVNRPSPSYGRPKPSPARVRTAFMKRLAVMLREECATDLERLGGGEWRFSTERGNAQIVSRFDTGGSYSALRYEIDCYDQRAGLMYRGVSPLSWLCVSSSEWNDVEIADGVPLLDAIRVGMAAVDQAVASWIL
jgi:hypothetical protein